MLCVVETWRCNEDMASLTIPGYTCFYKNRKIKHKKALRNSGGIAVYVKTMLHFEQCETTCDDFLWLKWRKGGSDGASNNIYFCICYIPPATSPRHVDVNGDLFDILAAQIGIFSAMGEVILVGDFNSRIGKYNKFVYDFANMHEPFVPDTAMTSRADYDLITERRTSDITVDAFGRKLIEICDANHLVVMNGRSKSDLVPAHLTCIKRSKEGAIQGGSVVDYGIVSCNLFPSVTDFQILPDVALGLSKHMPFVLSLNFQDGYEQRGVVTEQSTGRTEKYIWNPGFRDTFRARLQEPSSSEKQAEILQIDPVNVSSISDSVNCLYSIFRDAAGRELRKKVPAASANHRPQPDWWNAECNSKNAIFLDALDAFSHFKCEYTKTVMRNKRNIFRSAVRRAKWAYRRTLSRKLQKCDARDPRQFWRIFNGPKAVDRTNAPSPLQFFDYFSALYETNAPNQDRITWQQTVLNYLELPNGHEQVFAAPFCTADINKAASKLKSGKSAGPDLIPNEFLKNSVDLLDGPLLSIFNAVLSNCHYPSEWAVATIVPLFKSGDASKVPNYRGISLISNVAKLFDTCVDFRIQEWLRNTDFSTDFQFAYKKNRSTTDAVFTLNGIIEIQRKKHEKLYCSFVDFSKAFDHVDRDALFYKLARIHAPSSLIRLVRDYYSKVKSSVKNHPGSTFQSTLGVQQGHVWSPTLFTIYTSDLLTDIVDGGGGSVDINGVSASLLAYADDIALLASSADGLQRSLDILALFCDKWNLTVNIAKTKVMIFRNPGPLRMQDIFFYDGSALEIVNDFKYLGLTLSVTGISGAMVDARVSQATKAKYALLYKLRSFCMHIKTKLRLFDCLVGSTALYGCEIFSHLNISDIEKTQNSYIRSILGVKQSTPIVALMGETGRYPMEITIQLRTLKYWIKLINMNPNSMPLSVYSNMRTLHQQGSRIKWIDNVYSILCLAGERDCWRNQSAPHPGRLITKVKTALKDRYKQSWLLSVNTMPSLESYCLYKTHLEIEQYFSLITNERHLWVYVAFRLHAHGLEIERGRYTQPKTPRDRRFCLVCNQGAVEDESHFVLACKEYAHLRISFIPAKYIVDNPTMVLFGKLMKEDNPSIIRGVAKFLYFAQEVRKNILSSN